MSIPVDLAELATALAGRGPGYLLSVSPSGRVKAVTVEPELAEGGLVVTGPGRTSVTNVERNPAVTLLWPPTEPRGYTLLVDGLASLDRPDDGDDGPGEGREAVVRVEPQSAVLHRPAAHADGPDAGEGCGHDCRPVGRER